MAKYINYVELREKGGIKYTNKCILPPTPHVYGKISRYEAGFDAGGTLNCVSANKRTKLN